MTDSSDFLSRIIEARRRAVARESAVRPLEEIRAAASSARRDAEQHALRRALLRPGRLNVIAEIKRASPSKGELRGDAEPAQLARAYERGGAAAISVLTEEEFFRGSLQDLRDVRAAVALPVLRKDFIIDEWQIYEAAEAGVDALLLIVAALDNAMLTRLLRVTEDGLGMDALVEVHTPAELERAQNCGAHIVGVNNRNLRTFEVSLETSVEIAQLAAPDTILVTESGLRTRGDLERLGSLGYKGFLIGETLMRSDEPEELLRELTAARD
ncbi:MAG: indole-3-glycerol phosphate synthase TrpC [Pyrinomonadaceae bacterium]